MPRRGSRSSSRGSSWPPATSRPRSRSRPSEPPPRHGRRSKPQAGRRSPSSNSRSRTRRGPASGSWGSHVHRRCDGTRGRPAGLRPRETPAERRGDRCRERGERHRHGSPDGRVPGIPRAPPTREHREPDARHRAQVPATAGHDAPTHDLADDALPAAAGPDGPEAASRVPFRAQRIQGQDSGDRPGRETPAAGALPQPRRDRPPARLEVRGDPMKAIVASGKRKTAVARATLTKGRGIVRINSVPVEMYPFEIGRLKILEPLKLAGKKVDSIDIDVNVQGGGVMGQADAVRTAIARGLVQFLNDNELETLFREYDRTLIVPDTRRKLPKKPLGRGARKKRQKSYR